MKKLFCAAIVLVCAATLETHGQEKDVTTFLGIPVDGSKIEMLEKLRAKGFRNTSEANMLEGEFNGTNVYVAVVTNGNKVYRIMVADKNYQGETDIKIRFNNLCQQFENNPRYVSMNREQTIPDDENLAYEIAVHDKRYEAIFFQNPSTDSLSIVQKTRLVIDKVHADLSSKYTQEQINNPSEEMADEIADLLTKYTSDIMLKKSVWFMISESFGKYRILMYYDNEYNRANGEDL